MCVENINPSVWGMSINLPLTNPIHFHFSLRTNLISEAVFQTPYRLKAAECVVGKYKMREILFKFGASQCDIDHQKHSCHGG